MALPDPTGVARTLFSRFDADDSREIDAAELQRLLASLGKEMSDAEVAETLALLDADGNGAVSYDEFMVWWAEGLSVAALQSSQAERQQLAAQRAATRDSVCHAVATARETTSRRPGANSANNSRKSARLDDDDDDHYGFNEGAAPIPRQGPGRMFSRARRPTVRPADAEADSAAAAAATTETTTTATTTPLTGESSQRPMPASAPAPGAGSLLRASKGDVSAVRMAARSCRSRSSSAGSGSGSGSDASRRSRDDTAAHAGTWFGGLASSTTR